MKSCANSSTIPAYINKPALTESKTPAEINAFWELGSYVKRMPIPMAMPMGVVKAYADAMAYGRQSLGLNDKVAIRLPKARPSKVSEFSLNS
jgi:hypothetical protein